MDDFDYPIVVEDVQTAPVPPEDVGVEYIENRASRAVLLPLCILLGLSLALSPIAPKELSRPYLTLSVGLAILVIGFHFGHKYTLPKPTNWFSVDVLFVLTFFIVHFGYTFFWLLGIAPSTIEIWRDTTIVCYAAMMSVSALAVYLIGYHCLREQLTRTQLPAVFNITALQKWRWMGRIILTAGVITLIIYRSLLGEQLVEGVYAGAVGGYLPRVIHILLHILLKVGMVLLSIACIQMTGKYKIGIVPKIVIVFFLSYVFILGNRQRFVAYVLVLVVAYSEYRKPISLKMIIVGMFVGAFVVAIGLAGRLSPERTLKSFVETSIASKEEITLKGGMLNIATSVRTLHEAVSVVPGTQPYLMGKLKVSEVLSLIPFAHRVYRVKRIEYTSSSLFLTWSIYGSFASGAGTTIIADLYLDFGYPGVIVCMYLLGLLCKYIQQIARRSGNVVSGVGHCCLVATVTLMPRFNVLSSLFREVLWPVLMVLLLQAILGLRPQLPENQLEDYLWY